MLMPIFVRNACSTNLHTSPTLSGEYRSFSCLPPRLPTKMWRDRNRINLSHQPCLPPLASELSWTVLVNPAKTALISALQCPLANSSGTTIHSCEQLQSLAICEATWWAPTQTISTLKFRPTHRTPFSHAPPTPSGNIPSDGLA